MTTTTVRGRFIMTTTAHFIMTTILFELWVWLSLPFSSSWESSLPSVESAVAKEARSRAFVSTGRRIQPWDSHSQLQDGKHLQGNLFLQSVCHFFLYLVSLHFIPTDAAICAPKPQIDKVPGSV